MSIAGAVVARDQVRLAEYFLSNPAPNISSILSQVSPKSPRLSAEQGPYIFTAQTDPDRITFLCCADKSIDASVRTAFVGDLQREWRLAFGPQGAGFGALQKNPEFAPVIERLLKSYNTARSQKLGTVQQNIEEAQSQMTQNLTVAMARGAKLSAMEDQANEVADAADAYHREAAQIRRRMCWERYRMKVIVAVVILVVAVAAIVVYSIRKDDDYEDDEAD
jgi:vesicle-associated membrane protein 72